MLFMVAVATALISAYQSATLKRALDAELNSALQAKQIDACTAVLSVVPELKQVYELSAWKELGLESSEEKLFDFDSAVLEDMRKATLSRLSSAAGGLLPYANSETEREINASIVRSLQLRSAIQISDNDAAKIRDELFSLIDGLARKCRSLMTGNKLGLI